MAKKYIPISQQRENVKEELDITGFVDLNMPKYRKMFHSDIKTLEDVFGMKWYSHREWVALSPEARDLYSQTLKSVVSGDRVLEMYNTAAKNYVKGIETALGDKTLSDKFAFVVYHLANNRGKLKRFYKDVPDLYLYYKRTKKDGGYTNASLDQEGIAAYSEEIDSALDKWMEKENILTDYQAMLEEEAKKGQQGK